MRFFDAHCDTIGKVWEGKADFGRAGARTDDGGAHGYHPGGDTLHVTLPGLRAAGVCAQVFAAWAWTDKYKGREFETGMGKVEAVRRLCAQYPDDLFLALTGAEVAAACEAAAAAGAPQTGGQRAGAAAPITGAQHGGADAAPLATAPAARAPIAAIASLEGADPLVGEVDNLGVFFQAGVRLITLAWRDNPFCGSTFGSGSGLTPKGFDLVEACEDARVLIDVSHASDLAFADICRVATRPFIASHSNCRALCPSGRNLTDAMIREIGERGGVVGVTLAPGFLSADYHAQTRAAEEEFWRSVESGAMTVDEAGKRCAEAEASVPRPPLDLIVDHVRHAVNIAGEDAVGLGGDLDGVDVLPAGLDGVDGYPRIAELLGASGLTPAQVEKVCFRNMARLFRDTLP